MLLSSSLRPAAAAGSRQHQQQQQQQRHRVARCPASSAFNTSLQPSIITSSGCSACACSQTQQHVAAAAATQQQARRPRAVAAAAAGKGFGNPSKLKGQQQGSKARRRCPCGSGQPYEACCARYISGAALAPTPEALLRSRFSAYALQEVDYLVKTTHRQNPEHTGDAKSYARTLKTTATSTEYLSLDISGPVAVADLPQAYLLQAQQLGSGSGGAGTQQAAAAADAPAALAEGAAESEGDDDDAFLKFSVKFRARGSTGSSSSVANEISHFKRVEGQWLYFNEVDFVV